LINSGKLKNNIENGAKDVPVGDVKASGDYNLYDVTGDKRDIKQITGEGWGNINWKSFWYK
jgi:hypothetical protein